MPPIRLFSADLDGTLLGNPESTHRFKTAWESLDPATRPLLVYNSGRLIDDLRNGRQPRPETIARIEAFIASKEQPR